MNDHEAIDAINKLFDDYCNNKIQEPGFVNSVARVLGLNSFSHAAVKKAEV